MHHRSPQGSKQSKNYGQVHHSRSLSPLDPVDLNVERSYLTKLRVQREKIQKLYLEYEQSLGRIQSLTEENAGLRDKAARLQSRLGVEEEYKRLAQKYSELQTKNSQYQSENQQLRIRYQDKFLENTKKLKQLKEYYNQEQHELTLQNNMLKDANRDIIGKLQQFKLEISRKRIQGDERQKMMENLKKQYSEIISSNKKQIENYRYLIAERDEETKKIRFEMSALKDKNQQQSYFIQLERQKGQELAQQYNESVNKLKLQIQSLERELLLQLQENNKLIENQQKYVIATKQAKCKLSALHSELQNYKISERDQKHRLQFKHKQEKKRLDERVGLLEQEVRAGNKQFVILVSRYERLQELMRKKQLNENAKRELIRYQHQEIDKMDSILKL